VVPARWGLVTAVGDPSPDQAICDRIIGDLSNVGALSQNDRMVCDV
jgi:hypothetical protein